MKRTSLKRVAVVAVAGLSLAGFLATPASAASSAQGGTATTSLRYTEDIWTSNGGSISVDYTNGIGLGGNNKMYLRVCTSTNDCSANYAVAVTSTGRSYSLGRLGAGTRFHIQYRAASNPGSNTYWQGTFNY